MADESSKQQQLQDGDSIALCASCDRCRSRKTKCDGERPCGNCAAKYMKKFKLTSIEGVDPAEFECIYSPAKRRGPVPGKSGGTTGTGGVGGTPSRGSGMDLDGNGTGGSGVPELGTANADWGHVVPGVGVGVDPSQWASQIDPQTASALFPAGAAADINGAAAAASAASLHHQLGMLRQLQQQQHVLGNSRPMMDVSDSDAPLARRVKRDAVEPTRATVPMTITNHTHLLQSRDPEGSRLYAYYKLSVDEMFRLPPTPTDDDYCSRVPGMTPNQIPGTHLAALSAARFAELALGALVHNEVSTAMELCNAVVHCLRESASVSTGIILFEVGKAYFLLGVFRAFRGDMERYLKYRRVCLSYLTRCDDDEKVSVVLAAISFLDAWAYMIYNANERMLPSIDEALPPLSALSAQQGGLGSSIPGSIAELKYDVKTDARSIICDPKNKNWIQGAPPVYLNNEAPLHARALDAIACAVRTCCDQANSRFAEINKEAGQQGSSSSSSQAIPVDTIMTPTTTAVMAHENELCSRNIILSAYALMQQHDSANQGRRRNEGQHMVISAMDAFLENSEEEGQSGFTDSQIQSLLSVCNTVLENPYLLHHAGPTYHMVTDAAVLLCHLLNGMAAMQEDGNLGPMESALFEEVLDTLLPIRKLLTIHRRKLPVKLRCHGIPRPRVDGPKNGLPFVDLGETLLCPCRGCQGFVLMACSPCVAAERAQAAEARIKVEEAQEAEAAELGEIDRELEDLSAQFDLDDDALLGMISNLISS